MSYFSSILNDILLFLFYYTDATARQTTIPENEDETDNFSSTIEEIDESSYFSYNTMSEYYVSTQAPQPTVKKMIKSLPNNHKIVSDVSTPSTSLAIGSTTITTATTTSTTYQTPVTTTLRPCKIIL